MCYDGRKTDFLTTCSSQGQTQATTISVQATNLNWGKLWKNLKFSVQSDEFLYPFQISFLPNCFVNRMKLFHIKLPPAQKATIASLNTKYFYLNRIVQISPSTLVDSNKGSVKEPPLSHVVCLFTALNVKAWLPESWVRAANEQRNQNQS